MLMDADNVIMLAQSLSNRYMPVCRFTIVFLSQGRGRRSWSAKLVNFLNFCTLYVFKHKTRPETKKVLIYLCKNILNKKSAILRRQFSENKSVLKLANVNYLDKSNREY